MLRIFRSNRRKLINTDKVRNYLLYALGEIFLIVIGILIAVQLNNWNENRKQMGEFKVILEHIYNAVKIETEWLSFYRLTYADQIELIEQLQTKPSKIPDETFVYQLFYLDTYANGLNVESAYHLSSLSINPNHPEQNNIAKHISNYTESLSFWTPGSDQGQFFSPILQTQGLPIPNLVFGYSSFHGFTRLDTSFFTKADITLAREMLAAKPLQTALKSARQRKAGALESVENAYADGLSIMEMIRSFMPEVRLLHEDIGIIGSGLETGWERSIPLTCVDEQQAIWETVITLQGGFVKFRSRDNWSHNWGGTGFPTGSTIFFGDDIPVTAGKYLVRLNLEKNSYNFIHRD